MTRTTAEIPTPLSGSWIEIVEPLAARFEVAAAFGANAVWNAEGSKAMAQLMRAMAGIIDREIGERACQRTQSEVVAALRGAAQVEREKGK